MSNVTLVDDEEERLLLKAAGLGGVEPSAYELNSIPRSPMLGAGSGRRRVASGGPPGGSEWSRRQTIPKRGPTRKVKLTAGKNFVCEYAVPTAVVNAVEGKWVDGQSTSRAV